MPKQFTFERAFLRGAAIAVSAKDGAKTVRANFTASWTDKVRKSLGWHDVEDDQEMVSLDGELSILAIVLSVGSKEFNLGSGTMSNFQVHRVDDGKKVKRELRFQYKAMTPGVAAKLEKYVEDTSRAKGSLQIEYEQVKADAEGDTQQSFPETEEESAEE